MSIPLENGLNASYIVWNSVPLAADRSSVTDASRTGNCGAVDSQEENNSSSKYSNNHHAGSSSETPTVLLQNDAQRNRDSKFEFLDSTEDVLYFRYGFKPVGPAAPSSANLSPAAVGELLGDPRWETRFRLGSGTVRDIRHEISIFLSYFSKARKLEDIPAELYELRQQGSAVLRPSPIQLDWETVDTATYYFLSPKTRVQGGMTGPVVLHGAATAVEVLRRDWSTMEQVALGLTARGIPFDTFSRSPPPHSPPAAEEAVSSYRGLGMRPKGFQGTPSEYALYESIRNRIFRSRRGRRALMFGGVLARLARGIVDPQTVCAGPTKNVYVGGRCIWDGLSNSSAYWDDPFTQEEVETICGFYEVDTGLPDKLRHDGRQKKFLSWWPTPAVWKSSRLEVGYWTPACEEWFQSRLTEIYTGNAQLHTQFEWRQILGPHRRHTIDQLAAEFLAENGTRIATHSQQFPKAIRSEESLQGSSDRFYFTLRTQQPDSPTSQTADEVPKPLRSKLSPDTKQTLKQPETQQATRQYWDMRRNNTALALRGEAIERRLRNLHVNDPNIYLTSSELSRRLTRAETELAEERTRFRQVENILEDIRRESKTPTVIPLLLSALIED